jgi:SAM-dependent methyltransferase
MSYQGKPAEYYDLFYQNKPYREEAQYVADLIQLRRPNAQTILDLGCGTGLRSLEMVRLGYQVSGLDQSSAMLAVARQHLVNSTGVPPRALDFIAGDITNFSIDKSYDAIISLFHVFSYLTSEELLRKAVACSFRHLKSGGIFLFDYWHGPGVLKDPPSIRQAVAENSAVKITKTSVPTHFPENHLVELSLSFEITENGANTSQHAEENYRLRYWFPNELERVLAKEGFKNISHLAWMRHFAPRDETWQACTIAAKS